MGFLAWMILGLLAGALAKLIMPGKDPGGWIVTMLLGIAGAFVGGLVGDALELDRPGSALGPAGIATATAGAIILLALHRFIRESRRRN